MAGKKTGTPSVKAVRDAGVDKRSTRKVGARPELKVPKRRNTIVEIPSDSPGYRLLVLLFQRASERNMLIKDVAAQLNVTPGYLTHLRNGTHAATNLSREVLERIAAFLSIPYVVALLLSDQLSAKDYYLSESERLEEEVSNALDFIRRDADWGGFLPPAVEEADLPTKQFIVLCYEKATGKRLVSGKLNLPALLEELRQAEEEEAEQV